MSVRTYSFMLALLCAAGCTPSLPVAAVPAPGTLVAHADVATDAINKGITGSVDLGFEAASCCGGGLYIAKGNDPSDDADKADVNET